MSEYKALFNITYTLPEPPSKFSGNARAEYMARRDFYTLTAAYNYFSYTLNGSKCAKNASAEDYFTRGGDESKGTGLFGLTGAYSKEDLTKLKVALKETKSIIWHGFISFDQETSKGFTTVQQAQKFMKQTFGAFLDRTHLKRDNITLYASLHVDKSHHHHIHFAFFENEPKRRDKSGNLGYTKLGNISEKAIEEYLVSANMHLDERSTDYYTARDAALDALKLARGEVLSGVKQDVQLNSALDGLIAKIPVHGRLQYNAENMRLLRPEIDKVAQLLIVSDRKAFEAHGNVLRVLAEIKDSAGKSKYGAVNGFTLPEMNAIRVGDREVKPITLDTSAYAARLETDYKARVGNIVLGLCKQLKRGAYKERKRRFAVNDKTAKITARRNAAFRSNLLHNAMQALTANAYVRADFQQSVAQIERSMSYGGVQ